MRLRQVYTFFGLLTIALHLEASEMLTEESSVKRIHAHLLIKDPITAANEARLALSLFSNSQPLWEAYIRALAQAGNEKEMLSAWKIYASTFASAYTNKGLIEALAWGVISTGANSSSPIIRLHALLGAFFSQDSKGVDVLYYYMNDCNSFLRSAAVQLASHLRDAKLGEAVLRLFREEKVWAVRLATIKAIGKMRLAVAKSELTTIIADEKSVPEEKVAAIHSLISLFDTIDREEVKRLASSNRAGLRLMACEVVSHFFQINNFDLIFPLLHDNSSPVRAAALQTLGILRISTYQGKCSSLIASDLLDDPDPSVAITAAWALTLNDPVRGQQSFHAWLTHKNPILQIKASAALSSCGQYAFPLALEIFRETPNFYVSMNLALTLIGQRVAVDEACETLCQGVMQNKERWMWDEWGIFRSLAPAAQKQKEVLTTSPEAQNQLVRLKILNVIAIMKYSKAEEALVNFLKQRSWAISGVTTALLLTEGDTTALELVRNLLTDSSQQIKVQAALILALWGREEVAITTLQEAYASSDRELKEKIIEGLGRIGAQSSIRFLIEKLQEPSSTLRLTAASSLLQCLYH